MRMSAVVCGLACSALVPSARAADGQLDLSVGVRASASLDATVGLDGPTRDLIAKIPTEMREQMLRLLREALPMIDQSVQGYLERVNRIVDEQIDHFACSMTGVLATMGPTIKKELLGTRSMPVRELEAEWRDLDTEFSAASDPHELMTTYADFLYNATVTACQVAAVPQASVQVAAVQSDVRRRWAMWSRVDGRCTNPGECVRLIHGEVGRLVSRSDGRDVEAAQGKPRLGKVALPPSPGLFSRLRTFDVRPVEDSLAELISIVDQVEVARQFREAVGRQLLKSATARIDRMSTTISEARPMLGGACDSMSSARQLAERAAAEGRDTVPGDLARAVEYLASLARDVEAQRQRHASLMQASAEIVDSTNRQIRQRANLRPHHPFAGPGDIPIEEWARCRQAVR